MPCGNTVNPGVLHPCLLLVKSPDLTGVEAAGLKTGLRDEHQGYAGVPVRLRGDAVEQESLQLVG